MSMTYDGNAQYWGKVTGQALGTNRNNNSQLVITFAIMGQVDPADPEGQLLSCPPGERTIYRVITDKTAPYVWEDVEALCGAKGLALPSSMRNLDPQRAEFTHDFKGAELALYVKHEPYEGQLKERWSISRRAANAGDPLDDKGLRQLDALFGKQLASKTRKAPLAESVVPEKTRQRTAAATNLQAPPADEGPAPWDQANAEVGAPADDIPF